MMPEPPFREVVWKDAWADGEEVTPEKAIEGHQPVIMHTRGWVLVDDEVGITLFYERDPSGGTFRGRTFIPRGMIVSVEPIQPFKAKRKPKINAQN